MPVAITAPATTIRTSRCRVRDARDPRHRTVRCRTDGPADGLMRAGIGSSAAIRREAGRAWRRGCGPAALGYRLPRVW
jgi:hypothetical protein